MFLIVIIVLAVAAALWWVKSRRTLSANERQYLKRRGYEIGEPVDAGPPVAKDIRLFSLIESLHDLSPFARQRAAEELSRLCASGQRDPRMLSPLIAALEDKDASVRSSAASAIANLGNAEAIEQLKRRLVEEESIHVRAAVQRAITKLRE